MEGHKTLEERYADEVLTDNTKIPQYEQCRNCLFRDMTSVKGVECGWHKCICRMYPKRKPMEIYHGREPCEYYEKEKRH